jgi:hypothetical protein
VSIDPETLKSVIESMGGKLVPDDEVFMFSLPVNKMREVVPKLDDLGVECRGGQEFVGTNPRSGRTENIIHLTAYRKARPIGP